LEGWNVGYFKDAIYFYFFLGIIVAIRQSQHRMGTHYSNIPIWGELPRFIAQFSREFKIKKGIGNGLFPW